MMEGSQPPGEDQQVMLMRLRIGHKLSLALATLLLTTVAVAAVGIASLREVNRRAQSLYQENVRTTEATAALQGALHQAERAGFLLVLVPDDARRSKLVAELEDDTVPAVERGIVALREDHADHAGGEQAKLERLASQWDDFKQLWRSGSLDRRGPAGRQAAIDRVSAILEPATDLAADMAAVEAAEAHQSQRHAESTYRAARSRILVLSVGALLVWLVIALALIRDLVPRLQAYSHFAARVAEGRLGERLAPAGVDEVAELGRTLDLMVGRREQQRDYEDAQAEFADTMQLSETEGEAHQLLKRHLERTIDGSRVTVLNRNNSADRLEAATPVEPECSLRDTLQGAKPRSCLAVRFGRVHRGGLDREPLLACQVCEALPDATTCEPLLVGGQVIGSVLVNHSRQADDIGPRVRESVTQAAPVLANLRNLAIAEVRAATDALTGLPNNRAVQDTLRRMVAQASRTVSPLSAVLLDLDHFKRVNDTHGHSRGDEVLAAVAATVRSSLRESDFVGRYGGEEFLILLPDTGKHEARTVAEKVRAAVDAIALANLELRVTASLGVATLPDDGGDADTLVRAADRALYSAKGRGRNRVELFESRQDAVPAPAPAGS
jgi:diguanylate cyclase (GGDEF)-like protein